jgi:hypothetical protein
MRESLVPSSQFPVRLRAWFRELRTFVSGLADNRIDRPRARLADTTDEGMTEMLARAVVVRAGSRWERAAVRATIGVHATRLRDAGATGEEGLARFKGLLDRALPPVSVRTPEQSRGAKDMVRWWVEAYYEPDV